MIELTLVGVRGKCPLFTAPISGYESFCVHIVNSTLRQLFPSVSLLVKGLLNESALYEVQVAETSVLEVIGPQQVSQVARRQKAAVVREPATLIQLL